MLLAMVALCGCARKPEPPIFSPDGSMSLHTWIEESKSDPTSYLCVAFQIRAARRRVLHEENTRASDVMRWRMSWISNECLRLDSSDIGTCFWEIQPDGSWRKTDQLKPKAL
jgi:hypothetical protein